MSMEILVTGATGLVGSRFVELSQNKKILTPSRSELDITSPKSTKDFFNKNKVDVVVNFASFTNVDGSEKERGDESGLTWRLNVNGVQNLSEVCTEKDIFLAQMSTDYVFKGDETDTGPYLEDKKLPEDKEGISWYGWSKNRAEKAISESGVKSAIVRIAYPFYSANFDGKLDYAKGFMKLFEDGNLFPIFTDQTHSVLNVDNLVVPLTMIIEGNIQGVFHIVSRDTTSPYEFAGYLLERTRGVKDVLQKGSMKEFLKADSRTPRPRLGGLKTEITEKKLGLKFKTWKEMVNEFAEKNL